MASPTLKTQSVRPRSPVVGDESLIIEGFLPRRSRGIEADLNLSTYTSGELSAIHFAPDAMFLVPIEKPIEGLTESNTCLPMGSTYLLGWSLSLDLPRGIRYAVLAHSGTTLYNPAGGEPMVNDTVDDAQPIPPFEGKRGFLPARRRIHRQGTMGTFNDAQWPR